MKKVFEIKKVAYYRDFVLDFLYHIFFAVLWSLFLNLITWSRPEVSSIIMGSIIFGAVSLIKTIVSITRKHTVSIYQDLENKHLIITQLKAFRSNIQTILTIDTMSISELKSGWYPYFELQDIDHKICISASHYKISDKKFKKIYKKLSKIINTTTLSKVI